MDAVHLAKAFHQARDEGIGVVDEPDRARIVSPQRDEEMLREAGFSDVACFYVGMAFRGWVALA